MKSKGGRKVYLDFLRIVAIFLVIFNHAPGFYLFQGEPRIIYIGLSVITKIAVPVFFMISGALLLAKDETYPVVMRKRFSVYLLWLIGFSLVYYILRFGILGIENLHGVALVKKFIYGFFDLTINYLYSYWFLYAYLGFLLMLPILQKLAKVMSDRDYLILFIIHCAFDVFAFVQLFCRWKGIELFTITPSFAVPLARVDVLFLPLWGYFLEHRMTNVKMNPKNLILALSSILLLIVLSISAVKMNGTLVGYNQDYLTVFDVELASLIVIICKMMFSSIRLLNDSIISVVITKIGPFIMYVYLLDPFWKLLIFPHLDCSLSPFVPALAASFIYCLCSMICGILVGKMIGMSYTAIKNLLIEIEA